MTKDMGVKFWVVIILLAAVVVSISKYSTMSGMENLIGEQWSNVETQYQYRVDLIPDIIKAVKNYPVQDAKVFERVSEARVIAANNNIDPEDLTAEDVARFQEAQRNLNASLAELFETSRKYPELETDQSFLEMQVKLKGIENRIGIERRRYNEKVKRYNNYLKKFPNRFIARPFGFVQQSTLDVE